MKLLWTGPALDDLRAIKDYIAVDSPKVGKAIAKRIRAAVDRLRRFPKSGRIVPELASQGFREVIVSPYRIVYEIRSKHVIILRVWHSRQELTIEE